MFRFSLNDATRVLLLLALPTPSLLHAAPYPYVSQWGSYGSGNQQFISPTSVAVDSQGNVYVTDYGNSRIVKFTGSGVRLLEFGSAGSGPGQFNVPGCVAVDDRDSVYVSDWFNCRIQVFDDQGNYSSEWGSEGGGQVQFRNPLGIAFDDNGEIYVADQGNSRIEVFRQDHQYARQWGTFGAGPGQFNAAYGVAIGPNGLVYVTDGNNHRIQVFDQNGVYQWEWGTYGIGDGQFDFPHQLAIDSRGDVFVSDNHNNRIQKFTSIGAFITKWGEPGSGDGQFNDVIGVALDSGGNVFVGDAHNHRVQQFTPGPKVTSITDVSNDQGGQVRIHFAPNTWDYSGSPVRIDRYDVYRRTDPVGEGWTYSGVSIRAESSSVYTLVVATLVDSNCMEDHASAFFIRAAGDSGSHYFDSPVDSGYSVDNLPPAAPAPLIGSYTPSDGTTHLHWGVNSELDFERYLLYEGHTAEFVPSDSNLISTQRDTGYADQACDQPGCFYKVAAVDSNCNVSPYARLAPWETADVSGGDVPRFALESIRPNPVRGEGLTIAFALTPSSPAKLELLDIAGRRMTGREVGSLGAGRHELDLRSNRPLAPGIYLVRLTQGARTLTRRLCVVR